MIRIAETLDDRGLFGAGPVLLSAGGSAFYDLVIEQLQAARLSRPHQVIVRRGCYLTQDWGVYASLQSDMRRRTGSADPRSSPPWRCGRRCCRFPNPGWSSCRLADGTSARTPGSPSLSPTSAAAQPNAIRSATPAGT